MITWTFWLRWWSLCSWTCWTCWCSWASSWRPPTVPARPRRSRSAASCRQQQYTTTRDVSLTLLPLGQIAYSSSCCIQVMCAQWTQCYGWRVYNSTHTLNCASCHWALQELWIDWRDELNCTWCTCSKFIICTCTWCHLLFTMPSFVCTKYSNSVQIYFLSAFQAHTVQCTVFDPTFINHTVVCNNSIQITMDY